MYENNQYSNSESGQSNYGSYGSASYSNYDFGSKELNQGTVYTQRPPVTPKKKEPSKVASYMKKVLMCASLGLFFGLCAGVGFMVVSQNMDDGHKQASANTSIKDLSEEEVTNVVGTNVADVKENISDNGKTIAMVDTDITSVVKEVMPAMVSIGNEYREEYSYFGQTFSQSAESAGSGIIVGKNDAELLVVTNYHVIQDADRLTVTFIDNTETDAQLKGTDASMDLAVLAVPLDELSQETLAQVVIAKLGDSDKLTVSILSSLLQTHAKSAIIIRHTESKYTQ